MKKTGWVAVFIISAMASVLFGAGEGDIREHNTDSNTFSTGDIQEDQRDANPSDRKKSCSRLDLSIHQQSQMQSARTELKNMINQARSALKLIKNAYRQAIQQEDTTQIEAEAFVSQIIAKKQEILTARFSFRHQVLFQILEPLQRQLGIKCLGNLNRYLELSRIAPPKLNPQSSGHHCEPCLNIRNRINNKNKFSY